MSSLDDGTGGYKTKCKQFEILLESFEEGLDILKKEREKMVQSENLEKAEEESKVKETSINERNMKDDISYNDKVEKMNTLNRRLSIFYQDLFILEKGLDTFEDDKLDTKVNKILPEEPNVIEMLVQEGVHFEYIQKKNS